MKLSYPVVACVALFVGVSFAETVACTEPTGWEDGVPDDSCHLNAEFSPGALKSCAQLEPDEQPICVDLCTNCFNYCNTNCDAPTTIFFDNVDPLEAGCSCVQVTPTVSGANSISTHTGLVGTVALATATVALKTSL